MWNFSLGACRLSSGRPKPIITLGIFSTSWKSVTIGIEPPERMKTVSFLKVSCSASVAALMYLLSVPTTQAGPLLYTLILVSMPFGVCFFTKAGYFLRMSSGSWLGTRRMETFAVAFAGITVLAPSATKPPGMP